MTGSSGLLLPKKAAGVVTRRSKALEVRSEILDGPLPCFRTSLEIEMSKKTTAFDHLGLCSEEAAHFIRI